jgi:hypothetical protein
VGKHVAELDREISLVDPASGLHLSNEACQMFMGVGQLAYEHGPGDRVFLLRQHAQISSAVGLFR